MANILDTSHLPAVLGTGLSGMVGSKIEQVLSSQYSFSNLDLKTGVDITNKEQVFSAVRSSTANVILHLAAFVDVKAAWEQRGDKTGICYRVNVDGTRNIAEAAKEYDKHLIHISTAFVFDGTKSDMYTEEDAPKPIEWYGETKAIAEEIVLKVNPRSTIFRIDQPFRQDPFPKSDTTHSMIAGLVAGTLRPFADHWFAPTVIEDLARAVDWASNAKPAGVWHMTCGQKVSDFEYAQLLKQQLHLECAITSGSLKEYLKNAVRPYQQNTALSNAKLAAVQSDLFTSLDQAISRVEFSRQ